MSAVAEEVEVIEGAEAPTSADLVLAESVTINESAVQEDGSVLIHLIRPCVGKGRGRHLYTAEMLEANAPNFEGCRMYVNHLSEAARRALGGLPRDVRDVGGIVDKAYWDPDVAAEGRFGQGAVVGRVKPINLIRDLIDVDPRLVEASINATATGVKRGKIGNQDVWVVEGISTDPKPSVDWVTEAGAGGRVATMMESVYTEGDAASAYFDSFDYGEIVTMLGEHSALAEARKPKGDGDGADTEPDEGDDLAVMVEKFMKNGMERDAAEKAAKRALAAKNSGGTTQEAVHSEEGDGVPELGPEMIREALASDEGQAAIDAAVTESLRGLNLGERIQGIVESRLDEALEESRTEMDARLTRRATLNTLREAAHVRVEGTKLTPKLQESIKRRFDVIDGKPTRDLDVVDDVDETGSVTKTAREKLDESLDVAIKEAFEILAEANPTRVRGQGANVIEEGGERKPEDETTEDRIGGRTSQLLRESGFADPEKALAITPESVLSGAASIRTGKGD